MRLVKGMSAPHILDQGQPRAPKALAEQRYPAPRPEGGARQQKGFDMHALPNVLAFAQARALAADCAFLDHSVRFFVQRPIYRRACLEFWVLRYHWKSRNDGMTRWTLPGTERPDDAPRFGRSGQRGTPLHRRVL